MKPTDQQRHRAALNALYSSKPRPRLINFRVSGAALLVTIGNTDGTAQIVRVTTLDQPELMALSESERSRLRSALAALHQGIADQRIAEEPKAKARELPNAG